MGVLGEWWAWDWRLLCVVGVFLGGLWWDGDEVGVLLLEGGGWGL